MPDKNGIRDLHAVLERINSSLDDFRSAPAKSASDRGAFGDFPLHKVAIWGDVQAAQVLLANGAQINAPGEDEDTPLHRAVAGGYPEMIEFLLRNGANAGLKNRFGSTPVDDAQASDAPDVVRVFERFLSK